MVNEIVIAKKIEEDICYTFFMRQHNEYHFVVDVVVVNTIFMQLWEVPIFDQPC